MLVSVTEKRPGRYVSGAFFWVSSTTIGIMAEHHRVALEHHLEAVPPGQYLWVSPIYVESHSSGIENASLFEDAL